MKILVTGGAGFIGSHLVKDLARQGHRVTVMDNFSTGLHENLLAGVPVIESDVRHADAAEVVLDERPQVVFHLAAQMNIRRSLKDPADDADVNILGGIRLFSACVAAGVSRIVFASSGGAVYGEQMGTSWRETDAPAPRSPYGIAKLALELYGEHFARTSTCGFVSLRLANVYGPNQNPQGEAGIVALFLDAMARGQSPVIIGDGEQTRDFVWVGDVVEAFVSAMYCPSGVYNIGTGTECSVNTIYERLCELLEFRSPPLRAAPHVGEVRRNALCINKAREVLGWSPRVDLTRGLSQTAQFARRPAPLFGGAAPEPNAERGLLLPRGRRSTASDVREDSAGGS